MLRSVSFRRQAKIGDAREDGGAANRADAAWAFVGRAAARGRELAARVWPWPRAVWIPYAMMAFKGIAVVVLCLYLGAALLL